MIVSLGLCTLKAEPPNEEVTDYTTLTLCKIDHVPGQATTHNSQQGIGKAMVTIFHREMELLGRARRVGRNCAQRAERH